MIDGWLNLCFGGGLIDSACLIQRGRARVCKTSAVNREGSV